MRTIAIIPARYGSTRLPGKALLAETGQPLICHVLHAARACARLDAIWVATDDDRIAHAVSAAGGQAVMTGADCRTGTDRLAQAADALGLADEVAVVNIQGDEPDIPAPAVDALVDALSGSDAEMATLACPLPVEQAHKTDRVKVVCDQAGRAMYFSRAAIPHDRDNRGAGYLLHIGAYAYSAGFLRHYARLSPTPAEQAEQLEQLRALEHGHRIQVARVDYDGAGIDTPADYAAFVARHQAARTHRTGHKDTHR
jgi:3-deoxy-manno-octulosonate cytidylyltransferase (CMP-KDO synthetase)